MEVVGSHQMPRWAGEKGKVQKDGRKVERRERLAPPPPQSPQVLVEQPQARILGFLSLFPAL